MPAIFLEGSLFAVNAQKLIPVDYDLKQLVPVTNTFVQTNNINTVFRSDGIFNYDKVNFTLTEAGLVWPASSSTRKTMDFSTGFWIGAKVGPQRELRTAASFYQSLFSPGNIPVQGQVPPSSVCDNPVFKGYLVNLADSNLVNGGVINKVAGGLTYSISYDAWSSWPVDKGAPYVEINGVPGYQPGWNADRPGIGESAARPEEITFAVFMDYTNCTNNIHPAEPSLPGGTLPMGAEIQQISFSFSAPPLNDLYFMKWRIVNKSSAVWDSAYLCIADDADVGFAMDDAAGCDTLRQTGFLYNSFPEDYEYGTTPPAIGYRLLQGPLIHTGNLSDTAHVPCINYPGYKLMGLTVYNVLTGTTDPCNKDPENAVSGYDYMRGKDGCGRTIINFSTGQPTTYKYPGDAVNETGWYDSAANDRKQILGAGPITMNPGDLQVIVAAIVIGRSSSNRQSIAAMLSLSDSAKKYYDRCFLGIPLSVQNISSEIPKSFALYQNYPNPFNPTTKIKFSLPSPAIGGQDPSKGGALETKLVVYNALGQQVATLVNERLNPGAYETEWDATAFPSGVYFYKLESGNFSESKKLVLIK